MPFAADDRPLPRGMNALEYQPGTGHSGKRMDCDARLDQWHGEKVAIVAEAHFVGGRATGGRTNLRFGWRRHPNHPLALPRDGSPRPADSANSCPCRARPVSGDLAPVTRLMGTGSNGTS